MNLSNFPPFYTLQPNIDTRNKQLKMWRDYILDYSLTNKKFTLDSSIFSNSGIQRSCSSEFIKLIIQDLIDAGHAEYSQSKVLVYFKSIKEWAAVIYGYIRDSGQIGSVLTLFEITNTENQEFTGIDVDLLTKALEYLSKQGKATLFSGAVSNDAGVKFF